MSYFELNIDGLVGPSHHYAGLAFGNKASMQHESQISYPQEAALQGLKKMRLLHSLGIKQAVMPPPLRPNLDLLQKLGFTGDNASILKKAFKEAPRILSACYSASSMWLANAATVAAAPDTLDNKIHFTPANLVSSLHRAQESAFTSKMLRLIFSSPEYFVHHEPLPASLSLGDEGAANTNRLCATYKDRGLNLFVYGQIALEKASKKPKLYPARQTKEASCALARNHLLDEKLTLFAQQNPKAIDKGVFHNDVISLANENVFLVHAEAFLDQKKLTETLKSKANFDLKIMQIAATELSLEEAVKSYFFNSQLISLPNKTMCLIAPEECKQEEKAYKLINKILNDKHNPIEKVEFVFLRQSMQNGGGPACLRLRVPLSLEAFNAMHQGVIVTLKLLDKLESWVKTYYRRTLSFNDLQDPQLIIENHQALANLMPILNMNNIYN
ncbi:MAG: N-succinylarginine dihydrolase [Legionellales bacterium RIFCSPHIGHO2_12_FULL_37_14]|nr:MAG: N-succinylarginine dihydrolase [Legionellales bacterium RIFCSPHIGHO2_12_FULL_37_14]